MNKVSKFLFLVSAPAVIRDKHVLRQWQFMFGKKINIFSMFHSCCKASPRPLDFHIYSRWTHILAPKVLLICCECQPSSRAAPYGEPAKSAIVCACAHREHATPTEGAAVRHGSTMNGRIGVTLRDDAPLAHLFSQVFVHDRQQPEKIEGPVFGILTVLG